MMGHVGRRSQNVTHCRPWFG